MTEWISIQERLPELVSDESCDVLIAEKDSEIFVARLNFYPIAGYRLKEEYTWTGNGTGCGCCERYLKPTHWMPLPEPPKII